MKYTLEANFSSIVQFQFKPSFGKTASDIGKAVIPDCATDLRYDIAIPIRLYQLTIERPAFFPSRGYLSPDPLGFVQNRLKRIMDLGSYR